MAGAGLRAGKISAGPGPKRDIEITEAKHHMELDRRQVAWIEERIARAADKAKEQKAPLTVERMAAELGIDGHTFRAYLSPDYVPPTRHAARVRQALQNASAEATASVLEHALGKGSGQNMHLLYLKQYGGFGPPPDGGDSETCGEGGEGGGDSGPVVFLGEDELT